jgi:type VI secretion system secreted protein VgrG
MTRLLRCALPVVTAALALANTGCGSKSSERTPTGPQPLAAGDDGQVRAMAVAPSLGVADSFGVLGASTVTNTGPTVVNGDLGISPGNACTGFPAPCTGGGPGIVTGTIHAGNATSLAAQNSITTAYNALAGQPCNVDLTGTDLGGLTLTPGAYCFSSSAFLTGTLRLNALGNPGAVWVFQIGSTLITASGSRVLFTNGGQACGAFWQVGSSATLGTATAFGGNILALASITATTGATNSGGLFARTAAVTLDSNIVSRVGSCQSGPPPPPPTPLPGPVPTLPPGAEWTLLVVLLGIGAYVLSRR